MSEVHGPGTAGYGDLIRYNEENFLNKPLKTGELPNEKTMNKESWAEPAKALRTVAHQQVAIHGQGNELYRRCSQVTNMWCLHLEARLNSQ